MLFVTREDQVKSAIIVLPSLQPVRCVLKHSDGSTDEVELHHTMNKTQISWFQAGSALNKMAKMFSNQ